MKANRRGFLKTAMAAGLGVSLAPWLAYGGDEADVRPNIVHKAFAQDDFNSQEDRLPKNANGETLPSIIFSNGKRVYRLPDHVDTATVLDRRQHK